MDAQERAIALEQMHEAKKAIAELVAKGEIPSPQLWAEAHDRDDGYEPFVEGLKSKWADEALKAAESKAGGSIKLIAKGPFRPGQVTYLLPAKAPFKDGKPNGPAEPGIRIQVGKVVEVPLRDEAHKACLAEDPNVEILDSSALTSEQEDSIAKKSIEAAREVAKAAKKK